MTIDAKGAITFLGLMLLVLALAPPAQATSGTLNITSDTTLTEDHYGSIVVDADGVTLDCAGFSVIGTNDSNGIVIDGHSGIAVRNCVVQQFVYGIVVMNSSEGLLENNEARWNGLSGIDVTGSVGVVVRQNTMHENGFDAGYSGIDVEYGSSNIEVSGNTSWGNAGNGFYTFESSDLVFTNNVAYSNSQGFGLDAGTTDSLFSDNVVRENSGNGFGSVSSSGNRFIGNTAAGNALGGFSLHRSPSNVLEGNTITGNGDAVVIELSAANRLIDNDLTANGSGLLLIESRSNTVSRNTIQSNTGLETGWGIQVHSSDRNVIEMNDVSGNLADGIWLHVDSDYNVIRDNEIHSNGYTGMPIIDGSDRNLVERNISSHNGDAGFRIETSHNTLLSNHANGNASYGFWVLGSYNKLALNSACDNGSLDALQDVGTRGNVWKFNSFCTSQI